MCVSVGVSSRSSCVSKCPCDRCCVCVQLSLSGSFYFLRSSQPVSMWARDCVCVVGTRSVGMLLNLIGLWVYVCSAVWVFVQLCVSLTLCQSVRPSDPVSKSGYVFVSGCVSAPSACEFVRPRLCPGCAFVCLRVGLSPRPCQHVTLCTLERQTVSLRTRLWVCVSVGPSQCVNVCVRLSRCLGGRSARLRAPGQALPRPRLQGNPPRRGWGRGARQQVPTCPRLAGGAVASRGGGAWDPPGGGGAGRGGAAAERARDLPGGLRRGASHMRAGAWWRRRQRNQQQRRPGRGRACGPRSSRGSDSNGNSGSHCS